MQIRILNDGTGIFRTKYCAIVPIRTVGLILTCPFIHDLLLILNLNSPTNRLFNAKQLILIKGLKCNLWEARSFDHNWCLMSIIWSKIEPKRIRVQI